MEQRPLGRTGVPVSSLCLGTMMFGEWGTKDHDESVRIIHRALDAGITFVDTADVYSQGESEEIVGRALKGRRDDVVLASKFFMPFDDDPRHRGGSRRWIMQAVENSLRRLGTDHLDLYQMHRYDPDVDLDETLGALTDLVRSGKVRYLGHSTFPPSAIVDAQWTARDRGRERFVTEQPTYSILTRGIENEVLPVCRRYGMGVLSYSPLAGGWLSGRYRRDDGTGDLAGPTSIARQRLANRFDLSLPANQRKLDAVEQLTALAGDAGLTLIQLAIAFVLRHPALTSAIIGPRTMDHLESQLAAADVVLSDDVLDRIDEIVPPGVTLNPADNGWVSPSLEPAARRR
jgi:aryl-alcohol dehydrogenase-like predicted oxidoreductase